MPLTAQHKHRFAVASLLKWSRRLIATVIFAAIVTMLAGFGSSLTLSLGWVAKIQLVPVALSVWGLAILLWVLATLIFGRIYCSTVCPLGFIQDIFARLPRLTRRQSIKRRYRYAADRPRTRLTILILTVASAVVGSSLLLSLLDPYGAFGRIVVYLFRPLVASGAAPTLVGGALLGLVIAALTLIAVAVLALRHGRTYCNTICPVGSALGLLSRNALMHIDINTDRCIQCRRCEAVCKAHCINMADHVVDTSRCVVCFDCLDQCDNGALSYTFRRYRLATPMMMKVATPQASASINNIDVPTTSSAQHSAPKPIDRRRFLATGLIVAAAPAVLAADKAVAQTAEAIEQRPSAARPVYPPGRSSTRSFLAKCVACGACISACPGHVLRPADASSLRSVLHPVMNYDDSYCRYNCTVCSRVCPTGALLPLTLEEKHTTAIGVASVDTAACIGCARCVARCPRHTITMTQADGHRVASVDPSGCIGCGACQYICPATPSRAITVSGL